MNWVNVIEAYLAKQRQLGYSLVSEEQYLLSFARFAEQSCETELTIKLALCWANLAPSKSHIAIARRFSALRPLSRYLSEQGHSNIILPTHYVGPTHRRLPPFIFSDADVLQLMSAAAKLFPSNGLRPITIKTLIGLMVSSGLRPGEAVRLQCQDVCFNDGALTIQNSKGWRKRIIPIARSTVIALKSYDRIRRKHNPFSKTGAFFEFDDAQALNIRAADYAFQLTREAAGLMEGLNGRSPRLYDLRHTFVCKRVTQWYEQGENVDNRVVQLSCYLGHKKVSDTYWYLTAIPALMAQAANRFTACERSGGIS
jgi:integrase